MARWIFFERFAKLCDEYVIRVKSPDEELSDLAIPEFNQIFPIAPALRVPRRSVSHHRAGHGESRTGRKPFHVEYEVRNDEFVE